MGCSSSSAQTVDQEKRPGTKQEESNGETVAVRNRIIAEDAKAIENQIQLPVQTALPDDLQPETEEEEGAVVVALEAQEDFGSGEDLLTGPEPQSQPTVLEEAVAEAPVAASLNVSTEPEAAQLEVSATLMVEALTSVEEVAPVETEVKTPTEATEEAPDIEPVAVVQQDDPAIVEGVNTVPAEAPLALEPEFSKPAEVVAIEEKAATPVDEAPEELAAPVETEARSHNVTPETASAAPAESSGPGEVIASAQTLDPTESSRPGEVIASAQTLDPTESSRPGEVIASAQTLEPTESSGPGEVIASAQTLEPTESSGPGEVIASPQTLEPTESSGPGEMIASPQASAPSEFTVPVEANSIIDTDIAAATIPEMPPSSNSLAVEVQAEPQLDGEPALETPIAPDEATSPAEPPCSTEAIPTLTAEDKSAAAAEVAQVVEAPASMLTVSETPAEVAPEASQANVISESIVNTTPTEDIPANSETPSVPVPAADSAHEPSPKVGSATEVSQETENGKTKKED